MTHVENDYISSFKYSNIQTEILYSQGLAKVIRTLQLRKCDLGCYKKILKPILLFFNADPK